MTEKQMLKYFKEQYDSEYKGMLETARQLDIANRTNDELKLYFDFCKSIAIREEHILTGWYTFQCYFVASEMAYRGLL